MTAQEFILAYAPIHAYSYAMREEQCHVGQAPSIREATAEFGCETVLNVIDALVRDFVNYACPARQFTPEQRKQLAYCILTTYRRLKITELILFFVKAKSGKFGKFYNAVEPLDITTKLAQWEEKCFAERARLDEICFETFKEGLKNGEIDYRREYQEATRVFDEKGRLKLIFETT